MGRSILLLVLLMSTLYAGIMISIQHKMLDLPDIISQNMLLKQIEGVSDYALRTAVRNSVALGMQASPDSVWYWTEHYNNFNIQDCVIDSIKYDFAYSASRYRARTYVRGNLMGHQSSYNAEIAFNFPLIAIVGTPNCFFLQFDQPQFNPSVNWEYAWDSTPNHNDGWPSPLGNISTRPNGQGANGWKCASFESGGGFIDNAGHSSMVVSSNFSMISFAKIRKGQTSATVVWMASDPYDGTTAYTDVNGVYHPGRNLRLKPSCGIYYENGYIYFTAVNNLYNQVTVTAPFTPSGEWPHNKDAWIFLGMTYNRGVVKGYVNGVLVGTNYNGWPYSAMPTNYGYSIGRRDLKGGTFNPADYKYMFGLLDEIGLYNRTLSDTEMMGIYNQIINPANIKYIRD